MANPFNTSSGVRIPEIRKIKTVSKNSTDGLAKLLYKAIMRKAMVVNTIKDDILMMITDCKAGLY